MTAADTQAVVTPTKDFMSHKTSIEKRTPGSLPPVVSQPDIRERARAAGCWLNGRRSRRTGEAPKDEAMAAFMSIFHPEIKGKKLKALVGRTSDSKQP